MNTKGDECKSHITIKVKINTDIPVTQINTSKFTIGLLCLWNHIYALGGGSDLVTKWCPSLVTPLPVACQAPLSMRFSRQEYYSELPFPSPWDLPHPGLTRKQLMYPICCLPLLCFFLNFFLPSPWLFFSLCHIYTHKCWLVLYRF